jgi:ATPase subunit of ABC transporter with duplicated ATPase domains
MCAECRKGPATILNDGDDKIEWNEEAVLKFLKNTYGDAILTVDHDTQTPDETVTGKAQVQDEKGNEGQTSDETGVEKVPAKADKKDETQREKSGNEAQNLNETVDRKAPTKNDKSKQTQKEESKEKEEKKENQNLEEKKDTQNLAGKEEKFTPTPTPTTHSPGAWVALAMVTSCCFGVAAWRVQPKRRRKIRRL